MKTGLNCALAAFGLMAMPFWYFLLYQILVRVEASTAMWVCYWIYFPISIIAAILMAIAKSIAGEDK